MYFLIFLSYLKLLDIFQKTIPKVKPPAGLLNVKKAVNIMETVIGSDVK